MELLTFALVAIGLYFFSDFLLRGLESLAGRRFEQRSIYFFGILLGSSLIAFGLIRTFA